MVDNVRKALDNGEPGADWSERAAGASQMSQVRARPRPVIPRWRRSPRRYAVASSWSGAGGRAATPNLAQGRRLTFDGKSWGKPSTSPDTRWPTCGAGGGTART